MHTKRSEFGYHPGPLRLRVGAITVEPRSDLAETVANIESNEGLEGDWIYAPLQRVKGIGSGIRTLPYSSRVFGLPKTHTIEHSKPDGDDHLTFHLWALSFFTGMRLTATNAGFVDATPIRPGKLVDFVPTARSLEKAVELAEATWAANKATPERTHLWSAAVHALFLGQNPQLLQFEEFMLLYTALDACFALAKATHPPAGRIPHTERVAWMCGLFGMPVPAWANRAAPGGPEVAVLRNDTIHEALFMGEPLGFALHGVGSNQNLTLEMHALICRLLVALMGGDQADYVRTPTCTRQRHGLDLA